jgi:cysteine desulfurase/selenocysteine lyase
MITPDGGAGPSALLPPGELRPHQGQLSRPGEIPPHPSAAATTPGIALAAARIPGAPTLPDPDPFALTNLLGRMANELYAMPPSPMAEPGGGLGSYPAQPAASFAPPAGAAMNAPTPVTVTEAPRSPFDIAPDLDGLFTMAAPSPTSALSPQFPSFDVAELTVPLLDVREEPRSGAHPPSPLVSPMTPLVLPTQAHELTPHVAFSRADLVGAETPLDPNALKREFPILSETVHGRRLVWLDNAATTQKPRTVIDRLTYYYEHENSNVHRAAHTLAGRATDAYESSRESVRRFLNAASTRDIVFVRGATEGINLVAQSWGRRHVGADDEVVITWLEHHANIVPWQQLCAATGARLRVAPVDDTGAIILEEYEKLLGPKTRIVALPQVSNALGTVTPAKEMVEMAHRHGARVLVDGAQAVSHMRVDVQDLGCDFFVFSGHKVFAPTGIGAVYAPAELLDVTPPWQGGGNMIQDVTFERTTYQPAPARFEAGTGSIADAVGLGAALDWLTRVGIERVEQYEHGLFEYANAELLTVPGLKMIGTSPHRAGVLSFVLAGQKTETVGGMLDEEGIAVRSGHHCAQPILRRFGLEATVRASLAPYNTCEDIDALVTALRKIQAGRR